MSYISHVKNESRMFDCMYDPAYIVSGEADRVKAQRTALSISAPIGVSPIYNLMFSDLPANCRQDTWKAVNPLPTSPGELPFQRLSGGYESKPYKQYKSTDCCGSDRANYFHYPTNVPQVINVQFEPEKPVIKKVPKVPFSKNKGLQSMFRETSMQTLTFEPEVLEAFKNLEINTIASFIQPSDKIGMFEVRTILRARRRREYEECLSKIHKFKDKQKGIFILEAFEWEEWIAREEDIYNCQMLRLEFVKKALQDRENKFQTNGRIRLINQTLKINEENKKKLSQNNREYARSLRKLQMKHFGNRKYLYESPYEGLTNPSSDFIAPVMRYGSNPNRRHFLPRKKKFDARIDDLEKKIRESGYSLDCPLIKLKNMSAPKQRNVEIEKGFRTEENLNSFYEQMKEFRKSSRRPTEALKCVKNIPTTKTVELKTPSTKSGLQYYTTSKMNLSRQSKVALNEQHDEHIAHSEVFKDSILGAVQFKEEQALDEIIKHEDIVNSIFAQYEGEKIGWIMQFLEEELDRLHEERRVQAFAMLAEKERRKLEAAEAGLRQKENIRREEQEYFFQNIQNSNISTVNEYLENVILEEYELTASNDTTKFIENVAKMIAMESRMESSKKFDPKVLQESVSDLLIPAIYKRLERKKLERADEVRYNTLDSLIDGILEKHFGHPSPYEETLIIVIEMLELLIDNTVMAFEASETSSEEDDAKYEAKMAIKKIMRTFLPKKNYMTSKERIADTTVDEMLAAIMEDFDKAQQSERISGKLSDILASFSETYVTSIEHTEEASSSSESKEDSKKLNLYSCIPKSQQPTRPSEASNRKYFDLKGIQTGTLRSRDSIFDFDAPPDNPYKRRNSRNLQKSDDDEGE